MRILGDREVSSVLAGLTRPGAQRVLDALSKALVAYSNDRVAAEPMIHQPLRQSFTTAPGHTTLFMPASNTENTGIKVVTLPGTGGAPRGSISIYAPEGDLIGLLNAEEVTAFRTALATMIPFSKCPFPKANIVVFGAGKQAEWHIKLALLLAGESVGRVTIINRSASTLQKLQDTLAGVRREYPNSELRFISKDGTSAYEDVMRRALEESDAIMCCTPSTAPLFPSSYLAPQKDAQPKQRFISLVGSYKPEMQEVDSETVASGAYIYVDSKEACLEEAGELIRAQIPETRLVEVGEMLSQDGPGILQGNMVYKCVGMGIMDIVVGSELLEVAKQMGIGRTLNDF